jgi:predicted RNA binding protein YcfA (HicA-like mRNA interferase family)
VSPALPVLSGAEAVRVLERAGFAQVSQRGSRVKLRGTSGRVVIVPLHDQLARGALRSIVRQAGLSVEEFDSLR